MLSSKIIIKIKQGISKFTKSEKKIAEYIMENPSQAARITSVDRKSVV